MFLLWKGWRDSTGHSCTVRKWRLAGRRAHGRANTEGPARMNCLEMFVRVSLRRVLAAPHPLCCSLSKNKVQQPLLSDWSISLHVTLLFLRFVCWASHKLCWETLSGPSLNNWKLWKVVRYLARRRGRERQKKKETGRQEEVSLFSWLGDESEAFDCLGSLFVPQHD